MLGFHFTDRTDSLPSSGAGAWTSDEPGAPIAIAGMTTETTALYLRLFAQDVGLRVVLHASHTLLADECDTT